MNPTWQKPPGRTEQCFAVVAMFFFSGAMFRVLTGGNDLVTSSATALAGHRSGNLSIQAIFMTIYVVTAALILPRLELFLGLWRDNKALLLLVGLATISLFWSPEPVLAGRRLGALMGTMFFGAYLAMRYPPEQLLRLLAWTVAITSVFSLVFGIALPKYGVHAEPSLLGAWRGVFDDKLRLGLISTLGILVFLLLALEIKSYRWLAWACLVLCGVLLALSGSRISWLITGALLIILIWMWALLKTHYSITIPMMFIWTLIFLGGVAWISANIEIATALIGRDSTLTGRTFLWNIFTEDMDRPYFGFGYRSYLYSQAFSMVQFRYGIALSGAHNGYLTLWLELGFVGIAVFLLTIWVGLRRLLAYFPRPRATFQVWLPVLFLYCLISTVPAPVILAQNHLIWVLFVASLFYWPRVARSSRWDSPKIQHGYARAD